MISNYLKIFSILFIFFFTNEVKSKNTNSNEFNARELSSYLSAIVALDNESNEDSLKYFKSSKNLRDKHFAYFKKYISSLVLNHNVKGAIQEIKIEKNEKKKDFFESNLLLAIDSFQKKKFKKSNFYLKEISKYKNVGTYEAIIYESLKNYFFAFEKKKILNQQTNYKNLDKLNLTFIRCYLKDELTIRSFEELINSSNVDYSRYIFFYTAYLIENNNFSNFKKIINNIDDFNSTLLVLQTKIWLENNKFKNFGKVFSCSNEDDILAEFFFLIANLYSTEGNLERSNFYLSLSEYLNKKFKYNLSLMADNYFQNKHYKETKKILNKFNENDEIFYWYKLKKLTSIISKKQNEKQALDYLKYKYSQIDNKNKRLIFDMANIYKNYKEYDEAINLYSSIINIIPKNSLTHGDLLYRRGIGYERLGKHKKSDKDLLLALEILPDNSFILNYLAYSWLERNINILEAVNMLEVAYQKDKDNPYITDSIGWAYYLTKRYKEAEKLLRKAIMLMPNDPVVNDHYGDILWSLNKKVQATYYWNSVLKFEDTDDEMKKKVKRKLLLGLQINNENS